MKQNEAAYFKGTMCCATLCDLVFQNPLGNKLFILILEQCQTDITSQYQGKPTPYPKTLLAIEIVKKQNSTEYILKVLSALFNDS